MGSGLELSVFSHSINELARRRVMNHQMVGNRLQRITILDMRPIEKSHNPVCCQIIRQISLPGDEKIDAPSLKKHAPSFDAANYISACKSR